MMRIAFETPDQPAVIQLIAELDAYQDELYPPESRHTVDSRTLAQPHVLFAVGRDATGVVSGCGAIVIHADFGELKRMYVHPRLRGQGMGRALIDLLEAEALRRGCTLIRLETGPYQPEALGLYERAGYARRGPFAKYTDDPLSVFMEKQLAPNLVQR
jgi:putative acetyltransferase